MALTVWSCPASTQLCSPIAKNVTTYVHVRVCTSMWVVLIRAALLVGLVGVTFVVCVSKVLFGHAFGTRAKNTMP